MISPRTLIALTATFLLTSSLHAQPLPGTKPLEGKDDFAAVMVDGIGKYLDRATKASVAERKKYWKPDFSSPEAYVKSVNPNRERFKKIIGLVDGRMRVPALELVGTIDQPALIAQTKAYKVYTVRWPVLPGVDGEGLLLEPVGKAKANVVAIPDADWTPEMLVGLAPGVPKESQFARVLAENGCRVVVPTLIDRKDTWSGNAKLNRWTNQTHREFVYRMAYQMGRHIIGYEVQRVLAVVDWFTKEKDHPPVGVFGYGEGGLLAFYSGAVDTRIQATAVSGYLRPREQLHDEPIYRNVWGLLREFGDAEVMSLIQPRGLIVEYSNFPGGSAPLARPGRGGAAPGSLAAVSFKEFLNEFNRSIKEFVPNSFYGHSYYVVSHVQREPFHLPCPIGHGAKYFLDELGFRKGLDHKIPENTPISFDPAPRQKRQFDQLVDYTQKLLPESATRRQENFWSKLKTSSVKEYEKSTSELRDTFLKDIIGDLPKPTMPMNPRTRLAYETPRWKGYEVVLDLYEDVICYGILLVPNDLKPGEKRPVVVCQHGLEGRPQDIVNPKKKTQYYNSFGAQLADRGFVVFAPQNPYIFQNKFRQLVRKGNPLKITLYSFIVRQHERILDWLVTLPFVDASRIAYYGLSYGGKVAMRIPALLLRYCLSICSGDFNEWIWKNITLDWGSSYMFTGEYEMYEFNLGNTFNYAEMAALIAPRPFMVERGHDDGVGLDEYVAFEYAKVRRHYSRLGLSDRTTIEFFPGGHVINGQGTFAFLHKHLNWPAPNGK